MESKMRILSDLTNLAVDYRDVEEKIIGRDPDWNPFTQLLRLVGNEPASNSKFWWKMQGKNAPYVTLDQGIEITAVATTLTVVSTVGFHVGDVLFTDKSGAGDNVDEWMLITVVTNGTTLEVSRGFMGSTAGTIDDGVKLYKATKNWAEGGTPSVESYEGDEYWNYIGGCGTQITDSLRKSLEDDRFNDAQYQRQEALTEHNKDVERGLILSGRHLDVIGDDNYYNGGGLRFWTDVAETEESGQHKVTATYKSGTDAATFVMDVWRDYVEKLHAYGNGRKYMLVGGGLLRKIRELYDNTWVRSTVPTLEFTVFDLDTYLGMPLTLVPHRLLKNDWYYTGFGFDLNYLKAKTLLPTSVAKVNYGTQTRKGYNIVTMKGLKERNPLTLASLTLTPSASS